MKSEYRNRLPHIAPPGATFFVTFRQDDSLPQHIVKELKRKFEQEIDQIEQDNPPDKDLRIQAARERNFGRFEHQLDTAPYGSCRLKEAAVAQILIERLMQYHGSTYEMQAYCIMPNHVHLLFSLALQMRNADGSWRAEVPEYYIQLDKVMQLIKGGSSREINKYLGVPGPFWAKDSYDHYIRNDREWLRILAYILHNPVKAGLVSEWSKWANTYVDSNVLKIYWQETM